MNVLFLCTGNSARSILAEALFNDLFPEHGCSYSAGSKPMGRVNPLALSVLQQHGHKTEGLRSKSIDEFTGNAAPIIDLVISVCDSAARDCPIWIGKGNPERLHWSLPDPVTEDDFEKTYRELKLKIITLFPEKKEYS